MSRMFVGSEEQENEGMTEPEKVTTIRPTACKIWMLQITAPKLRQLGGAKRNLGLASLG